MRRKTVLLNNKMDWNVFSLGCGMMAAICLAGGLFLPPLADGLWVVMIMMLVFALFGFSIAISDMKKRMGKKKRKRRRGQALANVEL